jgi:hypothetical protein
MSLRKKIKPILLSCFLAFNIAFIFFLVFKIGKNAEPSVLGVTSSNAINVVPIPSPPTAIPGSQAYIQAKCGSVNGKTISNEPISSDLCASGSAIGFLTSNIGWKWQCGFAENPSGFAACYAIREQPAVVSPPTTDIAVPIDGLCGSANGQILQAAPSGNLLCQKGNASSVIEGALVWNWKCLGVNNGTSIYCTAKKIINKDTTTPTPPSSTSASPAPAPVNLDTPTTNTSNVTVIAPNVIDSITGSGATGNITTDQGQIIQNSSTSNTDRTNDDGANVNSPTVTTTKNPNSNTNITKNQSVNGSTNLINNDSFSPNTVLMVEKKNLLMQNIIAERSKNVQPTPPVFQDAKKFKSPKNSGIANDALMIEAVAFIEKEGLKKIALAGKAKINSLVTIFIYSDNPFVITVKTDLDGNWYYELDKELANGQHEAYVTVTNNKGEIISKSSPLPFVKTAQAISVFSEEAMAAEKNKTPLEKGKSMLIFNGLMIVVACIFIALTIVGFVNYKKQY